MIDTSKKLITLWLLAGCFMVFSMVVIGGITRLTGSGLSITEWNVIMGAVPPLNEQQWNEAFEKYQQIPQFQKLNYNFSLSDFKKIFFWEYLHRLLGRLIGIVFIVPFFYFLVKRMLDNATMKKALFLFALGALQGFLGWFMVKSGLTDRTSVSHIRLAIHLITAFITFGFTFWFALDIIYKKEEVTHNKRIYLLSGILLATVTLQVVYGAFVAGLHAGKIANTFPAMDGEWIPAGMNSLSPGIKNFFDNHLTVQFIHRCIAYVVVLLAFIIWWNARTLNLISSQRKAIRYLLAAVTIQFLLGVFTLLSHAQITLAVLHQAGAFFLFATVVFLFHRFKSSTPIGS